VGWTDLMTFLTVPCSFLRFLVMMCSWADTSAAAIPHGRRPDSEKHEKLTQKDLDEPRYNLAHLSGGCRCSARDEGSGCVMVRNLSTNRRGKGLMPENRCVAVQSELRVSLYSNSPQILTLFLVCDVRRKHPESSVPNFGSHPNSVR